MRCQSNIDGQRAIMKAFSHNQGHLQHLTPARITTVMNQPPSHNPLPQPPLPQHEDLADLPALVERMRGGERRAISRVLTELERASDVVPQLIEFGYVKRAGLGIRRVADNHARRWGIEGVIIQEVVSHGAAAEAGLRPARVDRRGRVRIGDVIIGIDDFKVSNFDDLYSALDGRKAGEKVIVHVRRDNRKVSVSLRLQELDG